MFDILRNFIDYMLDESWGLVNEIENNIEEAHKRIHKLQGFQEHMGHLSDTFEEHSDEEFGTDWWPKNNTKEYNDE